MRRVTAVLALLLLLTVPAAAQWESVTTNKINPASGSSVQIGPSGSESTFDASGFTPGVANTDGFVFIPAVTGCRGDTTNLTPTRIAASDWALSRTATGAETINIVCGLDSWLQRASGTTAGGTRGIKITAIRIHHRITVLSTNGTTWGKIATRAFANATANDVGADRATAPSLPTLLAADPYTTNVTIATPLFLPPTPNQGLDAEWSVVLINTGRYDLYGITVLFNRI